MSSGWESDLAAPEPRTPVGRGAFRTGQALAWLLAASAVLSFLGSYAMSDALVKAEVIPGWPANADPRPRWMLTGFVALTGGFALVGGLARWLAGRQLRSIDAMADED
jgi:hypothetical protein